MSTTTNTTPVTAATDRVAGLIHGVKTFAIVFGFGTTALYVICDMMNWPLFTYHPERTGWTCFMRRPRKGEGPAMYWYGWTATSMLAAAVLGLLATFLPEHVSRKIPLALVWIVPVLAIPLLFYSLMPFWTR